MNRSFGFVLLCALTLTSAGCYHAQVTTGLTPGAQVFDKPWALGFVYGLIPPAPVTEAAQCPNGVAVVETELSFLNQLVSGLTFGIVTPMHIKVTCAAPGSTSSWSHDQEMRVPVSASPLDIVEAVGAAADHAVVSGAPVYLRFE